MSDAPLEPTVSQLAAPDDSSRRESAVLAPLLLDLAADLGAIVGQHLAREVPPDPQVLSDRVALGEGR
jgi:hypothetical protein